MSDTITGHQEVPGIPAPMDAPFRAIPVEQSRQYCYDVTRRQAKNFYYGMKLTPPGKRAAMYAIYAFMRACDDLADDAPDADAALVRLECFRRQMLAAVHQHPMPAGLPEYAPLWPAFAEAVKRHAINPELLEAMFEGQRSDLASCQYRTFDQLHQYCYRVASVVGLVCLKIWGTDGDSAATKMGEARGVALQLTNILRDVREDAQRGRIYLPAEDLERFGYDPALLGSGTDGAGFEPLMRFQIERARDYYRQSAGLEKHIDSSCRAASWVIMRIYEDLLAKIAQHPRRVLAGRVRLSTPHKLTLMFGAVVRHTFSGA